MPRPHTTPVKVLSIRQPWADLILAGPSCEHWKWAENRNWTTRHRGELFIHASRLDVMPSDEPEANHELWQAPGRRIVGAIIGRVDLIACIPSGELEDVYWKLDNRSQRKMNAEQLRLMEILRDVSLASWDHVGGGAYCFVLWNPRKLRRPIPTGGKLGLWTFNSTLPAGAR